jgi:hypothetical protein
MARGSAAANTAASSGQNQFDTLSSNASGIYQTLAPELSAEAAAPPGYDPATMSRMRTAAMQGTGGSAAGAVGEGGLLAARTRNAGTADAAIAESSRNASKSFGNAALNAELANANLQQKQRQEALTGESNLYGEQLGAVVPQAVNANTNAENASWDWAKDLLDPILSAGAAYGMKLIPGAGGGGGGGGGGGSDSYTAGGMG